MQTSTNVHVMEDGDDSIEKSADSDSLLSVGERSPLLQRSKRAAWFLCSCRCVFGFFHLESEVSFFFLPASHHFLLISLPSF